MHACNAQLCPSLQQEKHSSQTVIRTVFGLICSSFYSKNKISLSKISGFLVNLILQFQKHPLVNFFELPTPTLLLQVNLHFALSLQAISVACKFENANAMETTGTGVSEQGQN